MAICVNAATAPSADRPQTLQPPLPYSVEEVTFPSLAPDVKLAGSLTLPQAKAPIGGIVLVAGSGRFDRDEVVARHRILLVWADYFTRRGFAVLRSDKRGVGRSSGTYASATNADFADDTEGAFRYLRTRIGPHIPCGLVGHSGGATVASMVAARRSDVAWLVLVGAAGVRGVYIIVEQDADDLRHQGMSDGLIAKRLQMDRELLEFVAREKDSPHLVSDVTRLVEKQQPDFPLLGNQRPPPVADTVRNVTGAWFREDMAYDPAPTLRRVTCPVLVVEGSLDHQVFPRQNASVIEAALKAGRTRDYLVKEFPGVNHLLQDAQTGFDDEYGRITQTASPTALAFIADWIQPRLKNTVDKQ